MKTVDNFEFQQGDGRQSKYDWTRLLNGDIWELVQGKDFDCSPENFRIQAYKRAKLEGKRVRATVRGDRVRLQVRDESDLDEAA